MKTGLLFLLMLPTLLFAEGTMKKIDLKASSLEWHGAKVTGKHFGKVPFKSGEVKMSEGKILEGTFVADLTKFTVDDLKGEWATKFLNHMKSDDFFNVEKHPTAKLKITKVTDKKMSGDLTIRGKTNPVSFEYKKDENVYSGEMVFDRTKFHMRYGSKNFFKNLGDKVIYNDVKVNFKFVLK